MELKNHARIVADAAWRELRDRKIPPTPRNFEVWFSYCSEEKPRLCQRINELIRASKPFTPGVLDNLYQEFFAAPTELSSIKENSEQLQQIATQMADQVTADLGMIDDYGAALSAWTPALTAAPTVQEIRHAAETLKTAAGEAGERMRALEQLFSASVTRINELNEKLARSEKEAMCDALTGLANRRMFDTALSQATTWSKQDGTEVALLFLDIDHFKKFNDTYGHHMGDSVLQLVAQGLTRHIKGRDTAARYGGEEFAIILLGAGMAAAMTVAEQTRSLIEKRLLMNRTTGEKLGVITCSIGVAVYRAGEAAGDFIDRADKALYKAKETGRNQVVAEDAN
jgi:diguanylate cyclase